MVTLNVIKVSSFRRPYDPVVCDPHPHGEAVEGEYRLSRDAKGNCIYTKVGDRDISEYIGSFKNGCALSAILDRISLMPVNDKIRYLQQETDGVGADLSNMPTDGTEAFIMVKKLGCQYPQIFERVAKGESFDTVLSDVFKPKSAEHAPKAEPVPKGDVE